MCYITGFNYDIVKQVKSQLERDNYQVEYKGLGTTASMIPKLMLNPGHINIKYPSQILEILPQTVFVYSVEGDNADINAQKIRKELNFGKDNKERVHVTKTHDENTAVEFGMQQIKTTNDNTKANRNTAAYIIRNLSDFK
jgi:hypothetical protein